MERGVGCFIRDIGLDSILWTVDLRSETRVSKKAERNGLGHEPCL